MNEVMRKRIETEVENFKTFKTQMVSKANREREMRNFQKEKVMRVFGEEQVGNYRLNIREVYEQLARKNAELGGVADDLLEEYEKECKQFGKLARKEICDNYGEKLVLQRVKTLNGTKQIVRNLQLGNENGTTGLDMIVFTTKAIFIIEVKNTKKNIEISENGTCYVLGEHKCYDCNIKEKMDFREQLLREVLTETMREESKKYKIVKLVVNTNKVKLQNKCNGLQICCLGQLSYLINDYSGSDRYTEEELTAMAEALKDVKHNREFEFEMDMQKFKEDFATLLVTLEAAEEARKNKILDQVLGVSEKKITRLLRWIGNFMPAA